jgi:hypothetical protein
MEDGAGSTLGMDTAQGRLAADGLALGALRLESLRERMDGAVLGAAWHGPDAEAFRARWELLARGKLSVLGGSLRRAAAELRVEAAVQDRVSAADDPEAPLLSPAAPRLLRAGPEGPGPSLPGWCPGLHPGLRRDLASLVSAGIGWGPEARLDALAWSVAALGGDVDGIMRVREEASHLCGLLEGWVGGEHVPTVAELGASTLLLGGALAVAPLEVVTDTGFLDPRTEVTVHGSLEVPLGTAPRSLADLLAANDEARRPFTAVPADTGFDGIAAGRVRIQRMRTEDGAEVFVVHAPPTGGAAIWDAYSWGAQGNSAGWDSNLRTMAGQESAAMADVRAAMAAAEVPAGAQVMFVGHSQGGLTAAHLAADPSFNRADGAPGSYDVTHSFSVGSPVGTVVPAQPSTRVVNLAHESSEQSSLLLGPPMAWPVPLRITDPVPLLDLDGYRVDGSRVSSPQVVEVGLETPTPLLPGSSPLENAHNSVLRPEPGVDPAGGYYGTLRERAGSDPVLSALEDDLQGRYLGAGVTVLEDRVVEVGREDLR